jgi:23S rRNA (cytidine2498-2'-O)-methyltransferase
MECEFIFTCQQDSEQLCLNEMKNADKNIKFIKWLDGGAGLAGYNNSFNDVSKIFRESKLVFLRHIFPVEFTLGCFNIFAFDGVINKFKEKFSKNIIFSVQIRNKTGDKTSNIREIKSHIINCLENAGYSHDKLNPEIIISVFAGENKIYAGFSKSDENLSIWSGGMRHYAINNQVISRAEFKLLELLEYFPGLLKMKNPGTALDLGASPGGWTKILLENGFEVTAVDPNKLSETFCGCPNVIYYKGLTEDFINKTKTEIKEKEKFDLIVNDMRMNVIRSAKIMTDVHGYLKENGCAVMTFKLSKTKKTAAIRNGLEILKEKYSIVFAKQLFHNRQEITVVLKKL